MNKQLSGVGVKSVALCPGWVATQMSEFMKGSVPSEDMIQPADVAAAVSFVLNLSSGVLVPEIVLQRLGDPF